MACAAWRLVGYWSSRPAEVAGRVPGNSNPGPTTSQAPDRTPPAVEPVGPRAGSGSSSERGTTGLIGRCGQCVFLGMGSHDPRPAAGSPKPSGEVRFLQVPPKETSKASGLPGGRRRSLQRCTGQARGELPSLLFRTAAGAFPIGSMTGETGRPKGVPSSAALKASPRKHGEGARRRHPTSRERRPTNPRCNPSRTCPASLPDRTSRRSAARDTGQRRGGRDLRSPAVRGVRGLPAPAAFRARRPQNPQLGTPHQHPANADFHPADRRHRLPRGRSVGRECRLTLLTLLTLCFTWNTAWRDRQPSDHSDHFLAKRYGRVAIDHLGILPVFHSLQPRPTTGKGYTPRCKGCPIE